MLLFISPGLKRASLSLWIDIVRIYQGKDKVKGAASGLNDRTDVLFQVLWQTLSGCQVYADH